MTMLMTIYWRWTCRLRIIGTYWPSVGDLWYAVTFLLEFTVVVIMPITLGSNQSVLTLAKKLKNFKTGSESGSKAQKLKKVQKFKNMK